MGYFGSQEKGGGRENTENNNARSDIAATQKAQGPEHSGMEATSRKPVKKDKAKAGQNAPCKVRKDDNMATKKQDGVDVLKAAKDTGTRGKLSNTRRKELPMSSIEDPR